MLNDEERAALKEKIRSGSTTDQELFKLVTGIVTALNRISEISVEFPAFPALPDNGKEIAKISEAVRAIKIPAVPDISHALGSLATEIAKIAQVKVEKSPDYSDLIERLIASVDANTKALLRPKTLTYRKDGLPNGIRPDVHN